MEGAKEMALKMTKKTLRGKLHFPHEIQNEKLRLVGIIISNLYSIMPKH